MARQPASIDLNPEHVIVGDLVLGVYRKRQGLHGIEVDPAYPLDRSRAFVGLLEIEMAGRKDYGYYRRRRENRSDSMPPDGQIDQAGGSRARRVCSAYPRVILPPEVEHRLSTLERESDCQ